MSSAIAGLGGRLFEELRSKKSLAYTVAAYPMARQLGGAFVAYIACAPEREADATAGLLEEIERLRQELLPADEVERAKRYMIGSHQIRAQTNSAQLGDIVNAMLIGCGRAELLDYTERVQAVTAEHIRQAAQTYFNDAQMIRAVVRGGTSQESQ
jgi:zinc protease